MLFYKIKVWLENLSLQWTQIIIMNIIISSIVVVVNFCGVLRTHYASIPAKIFYIYIIEYSINMSFCQYLYKSTKS